MYRLCFAALVLLCQYGCAGTVTIERRLESHLGLLNYYDANKGLNFWLTVVSIIVTIISIRSSIWSFRSAKNAEAYK